jgi:type VI secretion system protein ImpJ
MKSLSRVVWSEGMYLGPHHFQTQSRYFEDSARFAIENSWFEPWGLINCKLDDSAIRNGRVSVLNAQGIFEDGLTFDMAAGEVALGRGDPAPEPRDVRDIFPAESESLGIFLAISPRRQGGANCDLQGQSLDVRYRSIARVVPDMNTGSDEKDVPLGQKNIRIVTETELTEKLLTIPIARVRRDGAGHLVYDSDFIPPCTKLTGSSRLMSILGQLLEILEDKQKSLQLPKATVSNFQAGTRQVDVANFWFLHTLHSGHAVLRHLYVSKRGHPEELFRELSRLAGALCTFSLESHPGDLPLYDHRNLEQCFSKLVAHVRRHLDILVPSNTVSVAIRQERRNFYWGEISDSRCFGRSRWVLGVSTTGSEAQLLSRVPTIVKLCSREWVSKLVERARPGLALAHMQSAPSAIVPKAEFHYFAIDRNDQIGNPSPCWNHIVDTRQVGIYVPDELANVDLELQIVLDV